MILSQSLAHFYFYSARDFLLFGKKIDRIYLSWLAYEKYLPTYEIEVYCALADSMLATNLLISSEKGDMIGSRSYSTLARALDFIQCSLDQRKPTNFDDPQF